MPPWGPPPGAGPGGPRTIPIMMQRESDQPDGSGAQMTGAVTDSRRSSSASSSASGSRTPSQAAAHLGRVIPIQIEREETGRAKGAKIIPIKVTWYFTDFYAAHPFVRKGNRVFINRNFHFYRLKDGLPE